MSLKNMWTQLKSWLGFSKATNTAGSVQSTSLTIPIKLSTGATYPVFGTTGAAGADMTAISVEHTENYIEYNTGVSMAIPVGYVGLLFPRSSVSNLGEGFMLRNSVGVIDSDYRGEIKFRYSKPCCDGPIYAAGERVGQIIILPFPKVQYSVGVLSATDRGWGGFGSTN
jgi:dUTP pyrophosphatase